VPIDWDKRQGSKPKHRSRPEPPAPPRSRLSAKAIRSTLFGDVTELSQAELVTHESCTMARKLIHEFDDVCLVDLNARATASEDERWAVLTLSSAHDAMHVLCVPEDGYCVTLTTSRTSHSSCTTMMSPDYVVGLALERLESST
jgi:hypothetical protein